MNYFIDPTQVLYADLDPKEGVVLNLKTKRYFKLNETGQLIWKGLQNNKSMSQLASEITLAFDTNIDNAKTDLDHFIEHLLQENILSQTKPQSVNKETATNEILDTVKAARKSKTSKDIKF